jgi:signal peptidase I
MKRAILLLFIFVLCIAGVLVVKGVFSLVPVLDDNMAPEIQTGSLLTIKAIRPENIQVGDIIIYDVPSGMQDYYHYPAVVFHRVVEIQATPSLGFRTKGTNTGEDPFTIHPEDIKGTIGTTIPYLGLPLLFFQGSQGTGFLIILLLLLTFLLYNREILNNAVILYQRIFSPETNKALQDIPELVRKVETVNKKADTVNKKTEIIDKKTDIIDKKTDIIDKKTETPKPARPGPEKAARKIARPLFPTPHLSAPPKDKHKHDELPEEATKAQKELSEALDRLNSLLKKYKN